MGRNLTSLYISQSFQGLTQISGSILTDGTGSEISNLTITASNATSASYATTATSASYAVTSSYAENATVPNLQSVTDVGNTTTNFISSSAGIVLHDPAIINPAAYLQIGGIEDLGSSVYFTTERRGSPQFRLVSQDSLNGIIINASGSQIAKIDFSACPGEIEATGDITLDPQGGKVVVLTSVSASAGYTGSLNGNADTATSASYAATANTASFALTASYLDGGVALSAVLNEGNVATNDIILTGSYLRHSASFSGNVIDNLTTPTASEAINHIVYLSQAEYNAIPTPDTNTLYVISGSSVIATSTLQEVLDAGNTAIQSIHLTGSNATTGSLTVEGTIVSGLGNTSNVVANGGAAIATSGSNADGTLTAVIGGFNNDTGNTQYSVVAGGTNNNIQDGQNWSFIGGGENNSVNAGVSAVVGGSGNAVNGFKAGVFAGENNTAGGQYSVVIGGNGGQANTLRSVVIGGEGNQTQNSQASAVVAGITNIARGQYSFIGGGGGNEIQQTNYGSAIIGGYQNQVQTAHSRSVILGGAGLKTTKENQVVVPTLLISGSGGGVTFPDGTFQSTAGGGGGAAFPYTGSAEITGSFAVTGSQSGLLADNEGITIFASASANNTNGSILIGAQIPTQNNYNTNLGPGNIVIGSGDWLSDASGVLNGGGEFNVVIGGYSGGVNTGLYNAVIGGGGNFVGISGSGLSPSTIRFNTIIAGENNGIDDRTNWSGIFAGRNNKMGIIGTNSNQYSVLVGGNGNHISSSDWSAIIGGNSHQMEFANYSGILAGNNHTFTYGSNTSAYSALVGGANNTMAHIRSVVIGGSFLSSTKDDEVLVPNLTISGSVTAGVYTLTDVAGTTTMDCSLGNFFTLTMPAGGSTTLTPTNIQAGQTISVKITQNATPSTIAFAAGVEFESGTPFAVSTGAGEVDVMTFISFDGTTLQATGLKNFS